MLATRFGFRLWAFARAFFEGHDLEEHGGVQHAEHRTILPTPAGDVPVPADLGTAGCPWHFPSHFGYPFCATAVWQRGYCWLHFSALAMQGACKEQSVDDIPSNAQWPWQDKGAPFLLVELKGEPLPKKRQKGTTRQQSFRGWGGKVSDHTSKRAGLLFIGRRLMTKLRA